MSIAPLAEDAIACGLYLLPKTSDANEPHRSVFIPLLGRRADLFVRIDSYLLNPCFPAVELIVAMVSVVGEIFRATVALSTSPQDNSV